MRAELARARAVEAATGRRGGGVAAGGRKGGEGAARAGRRGRRRVRRLGLGVGGGDHPIGACMLMCVSGAGFFSGLGPLCARSRDWPVCVFVGRRGGAIRQTVVCRRTDSHIIV